MNYCLGISASQKNDAENSYLIDIQRITDLQMIEKEHWNATLRNSEFDSVFMTYEWLSCWWKTLRRNSELFVLLATKNEKLIGIAPLMLSRRSFGPLCYKTLEFIGTGESDYCDIIASAAEKEEVLARVVEYLHSNRAEWDMISLTQIPKHSRTLERLDHLAGQYKYFRRQTLKALCPALLIKSDPDFAQSCTRKKSLKRHFNYFARNGALDYGTAQSVEEILVELDDFFMQHIDRRALAGDTSKFCDHRYRLFYQCLAHTLFESGWLRFAIVRFNDIPIAYHFGFEYRGKFIWYKPTFNVDYLKRSPGEVLIKLLLEQAIAAELLEFDFTIGDEAFKRRFANVIRQNMQIEICNRLILWTAIQSTVHLKDWFKKGFPRTYVYFKSLLLRDEISANDR